jgi:hypothetical protein
MDVCPSVYVCVWKLNGSLKPLPLFELLAGDIVLGLSALSGVKLELRIEYGDEAGVASVLLCAAYNDDRLLRALKAAVAGMGATFS